MSSWGTFSSLFLVEGSCITSSWIAKHRVTELMERKRFSLHLRARGCFASRKLRRVPARLFPLVSFRDSRLLRIVWWTDVGGRNGVKYKHDDWRYLLFVVPFLSHLRFDEYLAARNCSVYLFTPSLTYSLHILPLTLFASSSVKTISIPSTTIPISIFSLLDLA